jgi:ribosomal-protein-alanine N-acetyltransferase
MTVKTAEPGAGMAVEIASLGYADLPKVIAIERRSFPAPWSLAMFVLELSKPSSICLGATHEGELIGYLVCSRYHTVWHVMNIAIDDRYRRRGVATTLIEHLFSETDQVGERYTLEVRVSNTDAIRMYESFGFRSAGIRRRYYHDNNEDALIMWRTHH